MKLRLDPTVTAALERATIEAQRAGHGEVTREHLLGALLDVAPIWRDVLPLPASRRELALLIAERLAGVPGAAPYRGAKVEVRLSEVVQRDLEASRRGVLFASKVAAEDLLEVLLEDSELSRLVEEARLDLTGLANDLVRATEIAEEYEHVEVRHAHVLRALSEQRWFVRALHQAGGDVEVFRAHLGEALGTFPVGPASGDIPIGKNLGVLVWRVDVHASALGQPATGASFLALALREPYLEAVLTDMDISPTTLLFAFVHGPELPGLGMETSDELAELVFHNDHYTTQEFVMDVLMRELWIERDAAKDAVRQVHEQGLAVVARLPGRHAHAGAQAVIARAREAGFPLRVEVRPA